MTAYGGANDSLNESKGRKQVAELKALRDEMVTNFNEQMKLRYVFRARLLVLSLFLMLLVLTSRHRLSFSKFLGEKFAATTNEPKETTENDMPLCLLDCFEKLVHRLFP